METATSTNQKYGNGHDAIALSNLQMLEQCMQKWYSINKEDYTYTDIDDAAADAFNDPSIAVGDVRSVFEGDAVTRKAGDYFRSQYLALVEQMAECAHEEFGEYAENWLMRLTADQERDFKNLVADAVNAWADAHAMHPTFGSVENVREIRLRLASDDGEFEIV